MVQIRSEYPRLSLEIIKPYSNSIFSVCISLGLNYLIIYRVGFSHLLEKHFAKIFGIHWTLFVIMTQIPKLQSTAFSTVEISLI